MNQGNFDISDDISSKSSVFESAKIPALDGWRGVCILTVLFGHGWQVPGYPKILQPLSWGAEAGVHCFFIISGYLITTLLLREYKKYGNIKLKSFYFRRALRLLPAYFAFVIVIAILHVTPFKLDASAWFGLITFTANVYPGSPTTAHFWSLAVEQQFYLLWPCSILLINPLSNHGYRKMIIVLFIVILTCPLIRYFQKPEIMCGWVGKYSFVKQCDILAWGCLLALISDRFSLLLEHCILDYSVAWVCLSILIIALPNALDMKEIGGEFVKYTRISFSSLGFVMLVSWTVVNSSNFFCKIVNCFVFRKLGLFSYSIYIWHMIFFTDPKIFGLKWAPWYNFYSFIVFSLLIGAVSWYILEKPFFRLRRLNR